MKNADQIRQLLKEAQKAFWHDEGWTWFRVETTKVLPLIDQALALLPCKTCNCVKSLHLEGAILCPDCQKKSKEKSE